MTEQVLQALRGRFNHRGIVIVREAALLDEMKIAPQDLRSALDRLVSDRVIEILSPLPFLVVKWSGSGAARVRNEQQSSLDRPSAMEVPVSSAAAAAKQQREDGGAGEGGVRFLDEVLAVLGPDADRDEFREILAGCPAALIHRCLKRVEATKQIRVSKAALFRSLLNKLAS
jgi:hypothetical protein